MAGDLIRRVLRAILPMRRPRKMIQGSRPGFLWENYPGRWVPIERALSCRCDAYSEFGPVHTDDGLPV